jgi:hypothetical protein
MARCKARTKSGKQCKASAVKGGMFCIFHRSDYDKPRRKNPYKKTGRKSFRVRRY